MKVCARALALLPLFGQAQGVEDAAALIQQRQAVEALESEVALPSPGPDLIRMTRVSASAEAGSSIILNYSSFCEQEDEFGPKECALYFDMPFDQMFKVRLNGGLRSGDTVVSSVDTSFDHNTSSFWSFLVPPDFTFGLACTFCQDTCSLTSVKPSYSLNVTYPTVLEHASVCQAPSGPVQEEFTIANASTYWFKPPFGLSLNANATVSTGVFDQSGSARAQATYLYRAASASPPSTLYSLNLARSAEERRERDAVANHPLSFVGLFPQMLLEMMLGSLGQADEVVTEHVLSQSQDPGVALSRSETSSRAKSMRDILRETPHKISLNMTVKGLAAGNSITVASQQCTVTDSVGSVECDLPLGSGVAFNTTMDIAYTAAEGGTIYTSTQASVGGDLSLLFPDKFAKKEKTVPICGSEVTTVTGTNGVNHTYIPAKCGPYRVQFSSTQNEFTHLGDFANFDLPQIPFMPFLPNTIDDLMPISQVEELVMTAQDGTTIVSLEIAIGIKLA